MRLWNKLKSFFKGPEELVCSYCERSGVKLATPADYGLWALVPKGDEVIRLTCEDCTFYGQVYAITIDGAELPCAGYDPTAEVPFHTEEFELIVCLDPFVSPEQPSIVKPETDA